MWRLHSPYQTNQTYFDHFYFRAVRLNASQDGRPIGKYLKKKKWKSVLWSTCMAGPLCHSRNLIRARSPPIAVFLKGKIDTFYDPDIPSLPLGKVGPKKGDILTRCAGLGITTSSFTCLHCLKVESKKNRYHTFMQRR